MRSGVRHAKKLVPSEWGRVESSAWFLKESVAEFEPDASANATADSATDATKGRIDFPECFGFEITLQATSDAAGAGVDGDASVNTRTNLSAQTTRDTVGGATDAGTPAFAAAHSELNRTIGLLGPPRIGKTFGVRTSIVIVVGLNHFALSSSIHGRLLSFVHVLLVSAVGLLPTLVCVEPVVSRRSSAHAGMKVSAPGRWWLHWIGRDSRRFVIMAGIVS